MAENKTGIILLNMGGPDNLDEVHPYLLNIFRDPNILDMPLGFLVRPWLSRIIANKRQHVSRERYRSIGGGTPLNGITRKQAELLQKLLQDDGINAVCRTGMRYWHPLAADSVKELKAEGVTSILALSMYPQYCKATSFSSLQDLKQAVKKYYPDSKYQEIDEWHLLPEYLAFLVDKIKEAWAEIPLPPEKVKIIFSAHSIPRKLAEKGDPYKEMVERTYESVVKSLPKEMDCALGWQSAFGPAKWLEPVTETLVAEAVEQGCEGLIVVPLGFAAENIETLWDMDIDLKECAVKAGIREFRRLSCPNDDLEVMKGLKNLVVEALGGK